MATAAAGTVTRKRPAEEVKRGGILHRFSPPSKGVEMLRLERELKDILDRWRAAKRENPEASK